MLPINWKKDVCSIPNLLSIFRILLIPVYITIYLKSSDPTNYFLAAGILAISCMTDWIDGQIARHFNMITTLGKVLDPLADKATQLTLITLLTIKEPVLRPVLVLFIIKEGFQIVAGSVNLKRGRILKGALFSGKICTTVLFVSLITLVMIPTLPDSILRIISLIDVIFLLISFIDYFYAYFYRENVFQKIKH